MNALIIIFFLAFVGSFITFLIFKVIKKKTDDLSKIVFITYTLFILITAFLSNGLFEAINSVLVMEIIYIIIFLIILSIKNDMRLFNWLIYSLILLRIYIVNYVVLNFQLKGFANSLFEATIVPILIIYGLTLLLLIKKNDKVNILIKQLLTYYILFILAFSLSAPLRILTIVVSLLCSLLIGVIPGLILFIVYKKNYKIVSDKKDKGDFQNEKVKFF